MGNEFSSDELNIDYEGLLADAVADILKHENPERFFRWMQKHLVDYLPYTGIPENDLLRALATHLARAIWNGTPLPGNQLKPKPVNEPGRLNRCPCGSGKKYSQCCGGAPSVSTFDSQLLWPFVVNHLPKATLEAALKHHSVPVSVVIFLADQYHREKRVHKAVKTLELVFPESITHTSLDTEYALTLLCNYYDDLGFYRKKSELLFRIIETVERSPLRSAAWQRLAAIFMDADNHEKAWSAFHRAMQDDPDSPGISLLEVQLLCAQNDLSQAGERAKFWIKRLERMGMSKQDQYILTLKQYVDQPADAFINQSLEAVQGAGAMFRDWWNSHADKPVSKHALELLPDEREGSSQYAMRADDELQALEAQWQQLFPLQKPSSVHEAPSDRDALWHADSEFQWVEFLCLHPQLVNSISVLDDVAAALMQHPQFGAPWLDAYLMRPLLERSMVIVRESIAGSGDICLPWLFSENRPALRNLHRLINLTYDAGEHKKASEYEQLIIRLNPTDNHGYRMKIINDYLRLGWDDKALALSQCYPDDAMAEIMYGRILALYRRNELSKAESELLEAKKYLPKIIEYLVRKRIKKPKLDPHGFILGGDDQAWLYREAMRDVWQTTPGALEWLSKMNRKLNPANQR